ncbi:transmembrane protein FAM155A-like protein [Lates japonicus]|uniref:Transmembrane protein FAM155A-like protein n=1 Tax=Lates japonicus TaxID=270547 RepID=A0AAD3R0D3_LATJO|nr:transmembrane protein FAM155A-like protein [Lates japonicus]
MCLALSGGGKGTGGVYESGRFELHPGYGHGVDLLGCIEVCPGLSESSTCRQEDGYQEFELLVQKYEADAYSVRTCMEIQSRTTRLNRARAIHPKCI